MLAGHLVKEIEDTSSFLRKRNNLEDTSSRAVDLRKNLATSMASQIGNLTSFNPSAADELLGAISGTPYGEFTRFIEAAIDSRLSSTSSAMSKPQGKSGNQTQTFPSAYGSTGDIAIMRNPNVNMHMKLSVLVSR